MSSDGPAPRTARVLTMGSGRKAKSADLEFLRPEQQRLDHFVFKTAATYVPQQYRIPKPQGLPAHITSLSADEPAQGIGVVVCYSAIEAPNRQLDVIAIGAALGEDADAGIVVLREAVEVIGEERPPAVGSDVRSDGRRRPRRRGERPGVVFVLLHLASQRPLQELIDRGSIDAQRARNISGLRRSPGHAGVPERDEPGLRPRLRSPKHIGGGSKAHCDV